MTDRDALLAAVIARPEDDLPRLVFADWLEEHGESDRAAFIRAQIAAESLPPGDLDRAALEVIAADLLREHRAAWDRELPEWATWQDTKVVYRRGFVSELTTTPRRLLRDGHELFAVAPVHAVRLRPQVHLSNRAPGMFRDRPYYTRITTLRLGPRLLSVAPLTGATEPRPAGHLPADPRPQPERPAGAGRVRERPDRRLGGGGSSAGSGGWRSRRTPGGAGPVRQPDHRRRGGRPGRRCSTGSGCGCGGNRITPAGADRLRRRFGEFVEVVTASRCPAARRAVASTTACPRALPRRTRSRHAPLVARPRRAGSRWPHSPSPSRRTPRSPRRPPPTPTPSRPARPRRSRRG